MATSPTDDTEGFLGNKYVGAVIKNFLLLLIGLPIMLAYFAIFGSTVYNHFLQGDILSTAFTSLVFIIGPLYIVVSGLYKRRSAAREDTESAARSEQAA